ncbi:GFA family protein [Aspergillus luchuensis]|uniref:Uncharacterized protein n=1 Tax=Aspergillus kawachii TaxID=1069201 RepID=A0A7R7WFF7_ASPKA|nr:uncharacterized protein AKAW2_60276A [Aspergillus luchuensis]BCS02012.1 hypothetical protein AKAW2_60276A [Aspergillus luchuensis]BCS13701.1 hypothetical protein ALUC_60257A [Aspergillus luchuensis]
MWMNMLHFLLTLTFNIPASCHESSHHSPSSTSIHSTSTMPYTGRCNCTSVSITLPAQPERSVACHCINCKKAGGGSFSINYFIDQSDMTIEDPSQAMKIYSDPNTSSGNIIQRHFCSSCGSPLFTLSPKVPGKAYLKAALFDIVSKPESVFFGDKQEEWVSINLA